MMRRDFFLKIKLPWFYFRASVMAILLLLLLSGCSKSPQAVTLDMGGFVGGDEGLLINVQDGAPPKIITDRGISPFSFLITIENLGEAKVGPGTSNPLVLTRLVGVNPVDFGFTQETAVQTVNVPIENAKRNLDGSVTPGEITSVLYDNLAYKRDVADTLGLTFRAEICYDYESMATAKFCMKKDMYETYEDSSICNLRGPMTYGNSGAPLHVTNFEQAPIDENTIQVNFKVEHFGRGVFYYRNEPKDAYDACKYNDLNPNINKVQVIINPLEPDTYTIDCPRLEEPTANGGRTGIVRSLNGAPISMSCFVKRTKPTEVRVYEDLLEVKLVYRYGEFLEVPILIQGHP
jgi:hypothetical protein